MLAFMGGGLGEGRGGFCVQHHFSYSLGTIRSIYSLECQSQGVSAGLFLVDVEHLPSHLSKKNSGDYLFRQKQHFNIAGAASNLH